MPLKKVVVIHSGGMDSSICLALAKEEFGSDPVLSLSFSYGQRHEPEIVQAALIAKTWGIDHKVVTIESLSQITDNALMNKELSITHKAGTVPNTCVLGRNGLMARLGALQAHALNAHRIDMGVIAVEGSFSGYPDCSREYMDLMQEILRLDLSDPTFSIRTPLVHMSKKETLQVADRLGVLDFLLAETITCYEGLRGAGCATCPACLLRAEGLNKFQHKDTQRKVIRK